MNLRVIVGHNNGTAQVGKLHELGSAVQEPMGADGNFLADDAFLFIGQMSSVDHRSA